MKRANYHDIQHAESARMAWRVNVADDHELKDVRHPGYLWDRASQFRPGDRVEYWATDGRFFLEHIVLGIDEKTRSILTREIACVEWGKAVPRRVVIADAKIEWGGPQHKFRVLIGQDVVAKGFTTKDKAQEWIDEQVALARAAEIEAAEKAEAA